MKIQASPVASFNNTYLPRDPDLIPVSAVNGSPVGDLIVAVLARFPADETIVSRLGFEEMQQWNSKMLGTESFRNSNAFFRSNSNPVIHWIDKRYKRQPITTCTIQKTTETRDPYPEQVE